MITAAWKTSTIPALLRLHQIQVPNLRINRPDAGDFGTYRIVVEVYHTLSGMYCACFRSRQCHLKHESHLSIESDIEYGFHGTNPWERWQLLNFYKHIFEHRNFDAERMQQAKRQGKEAFENYIETLVPQYRRKIANWILADAIFPKLGGRLKCHGGTFNCYCVLHHAWVPERLDCLTRHRVAK